MKIFTVLWFLFSSTVFGANSSTISGTEDGDIIISVVQEIILKSQQKEERLLETIEIFRNEIKEHKQEIVNLKSKVSTLESKTQHMISDNENTYFENTNVHIRNGSDSTSNVNGLGNLIIGYNEDQFDINGTFYRFHEWEDSTGGSYPIGNRNISDATKGSHNLILGVANGYSSYAGIVSGVSNYVSSPGSNLISGIRKDNEVEWSLNPLENLTDSTMNAEFIRIKAGSFQMGNTGAHAGNSNEKPVHTVTLTKDFYIMKTPVTQLMWYKVMGANPSSFKSDTHCPGEKITLSGTNLCPNNPVEQVSWNDSQSFISKLNQQSGTTKYRFCTEAEWEYSAKAGTSTDYSFGNGDTDLGNYAWYSSNYGSHTHPVAKKLPNPWGLYDMHGNVYEWVSDWLQDPYPTSSSQTNPVGPSTGTYRVLRGGSWAYSAVYLRSSARNYITPTTVYNNYGFRPCRTL